MSNATNLAPPGAGLPPLEQFIARHMVQFRASRSTAATREALFAEQKRAILELIAAQPPEALSQLVLIPRLRGMEDSSRHWSALMTLEHLRIVNRNIHGVIRLLAAGRVPPKTASTAAVKPSPDVDAGVIQRFTQGCEELEECIADLGELPDTPRYAHPWFGPMNAAGWHFIVGSHMRLHRQQIELILAHPTP